MCTMLLVSTTIRQIAWSRRRETGIKRIVGASKAAIRLPFLIETLVAALAGTALAVGALCLLASYGFRALGDWFRDFAWVGAADVWAVSPIMAAVALTLTALASWTALARHVRV